MGVKDLSNVVLRHSPKSMTFHASLSSFGGATFALDASLITAKFHYANSSARSSSSLESETDMDRQQRNCVRSWYSLLMTMQRLDIKPIVVFDGDTRLYAKSLETLRRRKGRELEMSRGIAEAGRRERLQLLSTILRSVELSNDREQIMERYRHSVAQIDLNLPSPSTSNPFPLQQLDPPASDTLPSTPFDESSYSSSRGAPAAALSPIDPDLDGMLTLSIDHSAFSMPSAQQLVDVPPILDLLPLKSQESEALVQSLVQLYDQTLDDQSNDVYSKNQMMISIDEARFFSQITAFPVEAATSGEAVDVGPLEVGSNEMLEKMLDTSDRLRISHISRAAPVPSSTFTAVEDLVDALGIPSIKPSADDPHEAEGICAALYAKGLVDLVVSEDTDVTVYGAPLLRRMTTRSRSVPFDDNLDVKEDRAAPIDKLKMNVLDPDVLRKDLSLSKEEFVDFALLCGTDFTDRIPRLGPVKALALIKQYRTIESILSSQDKYLPADSAAYLETVVVARSIFLELPSLPADLDLSSRPPSSDLDDMLHHWDLPPMSINNDEEEIGAARLISTIDV